jgi:phospholipid/cholesterol/gamma-HCH transport system substrate-binding protein
MKTELKVGIFVLVGLGILVYFSTRVSDGIGKSEDGVVVTVHFDSVAGLVQGAEVRAAGIRVGHVKSIRLDRGKARVELQLARGIEEQIPKNSQATISSLGLLGEKYVEIKIPAQGSDGASPQALDASGSQGGGQGGGPGGGTPQQGHLELEGVQQGDTIKAAPPQGLDQLSGVASEIADDVKVVTGQVRKAVGEGEDNRVKAILVSLERFSASLEAVVQQNRQGIDRIVQNLDTSTETIREVLTQNQHNIDATIEHVRGATEKIDVILERNQEQVSELVLNLRDLTGSLKDLVAENRASLNRTVSNVESASDSISRQLPDILTRLDSISSKLDDFVGHNTGALSDSVANVRTASQQLDRTMDSVNSIFAKIDEGQGTIGKLINQDTVHDNLNKTMSALRDTLGGFQKFRTYLRARGEGLTADWSGKGYVGVDLVPDPHKFYRVELLASQNGVEFRNRSETTIQIGDGPPTTVKTEDRLFRDQFSITAALGYRWKNLALYAGVLEYRGGIGAEYHFLKNRAWLNFEAFDFGHPVAPHLKLTGNLFLTKNVMFTAGWDDMLDGVRSTPILGLGFVIEDEDIKNLLGLAAAAGP